MSHLVELDDTSNTRYQQLTTSPSAPDSTYLTPGSAGRNFSGESESTLYDAGAYASSNVPGKRSSSYDRTLPNPPTLSKSPSGKWTVTQVSVRKVSDASTHQTVNDSSRLLDEKDKLDGYHEIHQDKHQPHPLLALREWWLTEISSALMAFGCMVAVGAILYKVQHQPLSTWRFPISLNSLLSVLLTLAKTLLLLSVAESMTQLKWIHFAGHPRPLRHLQVFDDASKGPWGSLQLLWYTRGSALLASVGALIIVLSLAMDPFAQQILAFPPRLIPAIAPASMPIADHYGSGNNTPVDIDFGIQRAVYGGLFSDQSTPLGTCTTGNCTFNPFHTLGICSQCVDVSAQTNITCTKWKTNNITLNNAYFCDYNSPSGNVFKACSLYGQKAPESCFNVMQDQGQTKFTAIANISPNLTTLVNFAAINIRDRNDIRPNVTMKAGTILECTISWCAKQYPDWTISNSELANSTVITSPLVPSPANNTLTLGRVASANYTTVYPIAHNRTANATFHLGGREQSNLKTFLANVFTTSLSSASASSNWPPILYPQQQITMASALYQANGGKIHQTVAALANSLEAQIRQIANQNVPGTAWKSETYIEVKWFWLILPTLLVLLGIVFLAASLLRTWIAQQAPQWKSSSLAPLFHGLEGFDGSEVHAAGLESRVSMEHAAKGMRVQLRPDERGELRFMRSAI